MSIPEGAIPVFTTAGGEVPVGYALRQSDGPPAFTITRAWKVGQWRWHLGAPNYWYHDSVQHSWEAVKARAADLRANGWNGPVEAMPFFCIVDGDHTAHEVKSAPLNARGEWVPERECVVMVDG